MEDLVVGNIVQLNSGGCKMTVSKVAGQTAITCTFFDGQGEADEITVPRSCLKKMPARKRK